MSWDIYLTVTTAACEHCGRPKDENVVYERNYTSNMYPMLKRAGFDWDEIQKARGVDAFPVVDRLVIELKREPEEYRALNPKNNWGDYDSFLAMLEEFCAALAEYPMAEVYISR